MSNFIFNDLELTFNDYHKKVIVPKLKSSLGEDKNIMSLPSLAAIVVHIRINSNNAKDKAYVKSVVDDLTMLSGQKAALVKAKKSVSNFKLREGNLSGAKVTLRRNKMKSFLFALRDIVIPSLRDFRGLPKKFSETGSYSLSIFNHDIFPGVNINEIKHNFKVQVNFVMKNVNNKEDGLALLDACELPFVKKRG